VPGLFSLFKNAFGKGQTAERLDYQASCGKLHKLGFIDSALPPIPDHRPRYDDEEPLGVNFFRTSVEGDLSNLTLPRTFFSRSEIEKASFRNTDLHESNLCWNDFSNVDFSGANLSDSDLRASKFERVLFARCNLTKADLRRSSFDDCSFKDASMDGTILTRDQQHNLVLSAAQISGINWTDDAGEEPDGG